MGLGLGFGFVVVVTGTDEVVDDGVVVEVEGTVDVVDVVVGTVFLMVDDAGTNLTGR
jgi:hypothetical protein